MVKKREHLSIEVISDRNLAEVTLAVPKEDFEREKFPRFCQPGGFLLEWRQVGSTQSADASLGVLFQGAVKGSENGTRLRIGCRDDIARFSPAQPFVASHLPREFRRFVEQRTGLRYDDLVLAEIAQWVIDLCHKRGKRVYVRIDDPHTSIPWEAVFCEPQEDGFLYGSPGNLVLYRYSVQDGDQPGKVLASTRSGPCAVYGVHSAEGRGSEAWALWAACARGAPTASSYQNRDKNCNLLPDASTKLLPSDTGGWGPSFASLCEHSVLLVLAPAQIDGSIKLHRSTLLPAEGGRIALNHQPLLSEDHTPLAGDCGVALGVFPYRSDDGHWSIPLGHRWASTCRAFGFPLGASVYFAPGEEDAAALGHCLTVGAIETIALGARTSLLVDVCARAREHAREIKAHEWNLVLAFREHPFSRLLPFWASLVERIRVELDRKLAVTHDTETPVQIPLNTREAELVNSAEWESSIKGEWDERPSYGWAARFALREWNQIADKIEKEMTASDSGD